MAFLLMTLIVLDLFYMLTRDVRLDTETEQVFSHMLKIHPFRLILLSSEYVLILNNHIDLTLQIHTNPKAQIVQNYQPPQHKLYSRRIGLKHNNRKINLVQMKCMLLL